jgi:hypothetical protein
MNTNTAALKTVAVFEALKGSAVLLAAIGVVSLVHEDAQAVIEDIVRNFHLNPASRYPRILLDAINSPQQYATLAACCRRFALCLDPLRGGLRSVA